VHGLRLTYNLPGVRIEFTKSRARRNRFTEEVELASVEMGRILRFYAYKSQEWLARAKTMATGPRAEAHQAYAHRQASMYSNLRAHCATLWKDVPAYIKRMQDIIDNPRLAAPGEFDRSASSRGRTFKKAGEPTGIVVDEEVTIVVDKGGAIVVDEVDREASMVVDDV
jgi:hypothetical protein